MKLRLLLIVGILFEISSLPAAANRVRVSNPNSPGVQSAGFSGAGKSASTPVPTAVPTATFTPVPPTKTPTPRVVVSTPTATPTPVLQAVAVWPHLSKKGRPVNFKVNSDPGSQVQLSINSQLGEEVLQTSFAGSYSWHLQNRSGSAVASGVYLYSLKFKQQGQVVVYTGKITVIR